MTLDGEITRLLADVRRGGRSALDRLFTLVYEELRQQAHRQLEFRSPGETLSTTALVHETYLRLAGAGPLAIEDRRHFFAVAARAMRQIAIDHARRAAAQKRGGGQAAAPVEAASVGMTLHPAELIALDGALAELALLDERLGRMVELRFFAGLSVEQTAEVLDLSPRTIKRDWRKARAFLYRAMHG